MTAYGLVNVEFLAKLQHVLRILCLVRKFQFYLLMRLLPPFVICSFFVSTTLGAPAIAPEAICASFLCAQLEELKAKDHQLALLDRNQYPDRGASLPKPQHTDSQSKEVDSTASKPVKPATAGEVIDSKASKTNVSIGQHLFYIPADFRQFSRRTRQNRFVTSSNKQIN
jgi:hypothetical protein